MQNFLRGFLPGITPPGFESKPGDLLIPQRPLPEPAPLERITTGPFAGLEVQMQTFEMRFEAQRTASGAICRAEQTLSLGRIALFQFFVFADIPMLDLAPPAGDLMVLRGRMHTNGRVCLGGNNSIVRPFGDFVGPHAVRMDARVTAVERILHASDRRCGFPSGDVGMMGNNVRGEAPPPPADDRLKNLANFAGLSDSADSGCTRASCAGGWRSFAVRRWLGRVQDMDHEVQELTLPVDPPAMHTQRGFSADGVARTQEMKAASTRPNTRFLVEPPLTNDPPNFSSNKIAFKAQIRIIDGVWYVKDPGPNNDPKEDEDDGPWPGIPIWSDHPGHFTVADPSFSREGVEGLQVLKVGQADIREALEDADGRLARAQWSKRVISRASPTPRRFSYYGYVDSDQPTSGLSPTGPGLQFGRVRRSGGGSVDTDPPAVISYGTIAPVGVGRSNQPYWVPAIRTTHNALLPEKRGRLDDPNRFLGFCGASTLRNPDDIRIDPAGHGVMVPVIPPPTLQGTSCNDSSCTNFPIPVPFPAPLSPFPGNGTSPLSYANGPAFEDGVGVCGSANARLYQRLALLEATRGGFIDTNAHGDTIFGAATNKVLPTNFNLHAFQEALADRTPGELGSFFCPGCLWESFNGSVFISNTWKGSMLGLPFPDGVAAAPPDPQIVLPGRRDGIQQPQAPGINAMLTEALPAPLCTSIKQADGRASPIANKSFFAAADSPSPGSFNYPYKNVATYVRTVGASNATFVVPVCEDYSMVSGPLQNVRPTAVRLINGRTLNFNRDDRCGRAGECVPVLTSNTGNARSAKGTLPRGLNVVSNVPVYVVGDMNLTSEVENVRTGERADDWIPFMVAGDTVTTLSNNWTDRDARWDLSSSDSRVGFGRDFPDPRTAASTRYNMLVLTGLVSAGVHGASANDVVSVGRSGGGLPSALRLMENWRNAAHVFRGSLVLGWMPLYTRWKVSVPGGRSFFPPIIRDWQFDRHLNATVNQPPDSPVFDVTALRSWRRD